MMNRLHLSKLALVLALLATPPVAAAREGAATERANRVLTVAEDKYLKGDYAQAQSQAKHLASDRSLPAADKPRLYLLLARLAAVYEDESGVKNWLRKLYQVAPQTQLDVYHDSPLLFHNWASIRADAAPQSTPKNLPSFKHAGPSAVGQTAAAPSPPPKATKAASRGPAWIRLMPFGIGHFDAARYTNGLAFLGLDIGSLYLTLSLREQATNSSEAQPPPVQMEGLLLFAGSYAYELIDLMPDIDARDPGLGQSSRAALSFFPFGAGQAKNGQTAKAIGFAVAQAAFLWGGVAAADPTLRHLATGGLLLSYAYGCYDAWANQVPAGVASNDAARTRVALMPTVSPFSGRYQRVSGRPGLALHLAYTLK